MHHNNIWVYHCARDLWCRVQKGKDSKSFWTGAWQWYPYALYWHAPPNVLQANICPIHRYISFLQVLFSFGWTWVLILTRDNDEITHLLFKSLNATCKLLISDSRHIIVMLNYTCNYDVFYILICSKMLHGNISLLLTYRQSMWCLLLVQNVAFTIEKFCAKLFLN